MSKISTSQHTCSGCYYRLVQANGKSICRISGQFIMDDTPFCSNYTKAKSYETDQVCQFCVYFLEFFNTDTAKCSYHCAKTDGIIKTKLKDTCYEFLKRTRIQDRYANNRAKLNYLYSCGRGTPKDRLFQRLDLMTRSDYFLLTSSERLRERIKRKATN